MLPVTARVTKQVLQLLMCRSPANRKRGLRLQANLALDFVRNFTLSIALILMFSLACVTARAEGVEITQAHIESSDEGYKLSVTHAFELNHGLEDAITKGIQLYFTTDVRLTRPRWYWFDETAITTSRTIRVDYNVLTRQFRAGQIGSIQQNFNSLEDVLSYLRRPNRWVIADKGMLKPGETYTVAVRMGLDLAHLAKPFQVNALNNSDWQFSSDWKRFKYKAE
ncbi:DUF4390 domain-containing protein [soil metagenome]